MLYAILYVLATRDLHFFMCLYLYVLKDHKKVKASDSYLAIII